jgi:PhnB protein
MRMGIGVYVPIGDQRCDVIFGVGPRLVRVQCKFAAFHGNFIQVNFRSARRAAEGIRRRLYSPDEIDAFAAYSLDTNRCDYFEASVFAPDQQVRPASPVPQQPIRAGAVGEGLRIRRYTSETPGAHSSAGRASGWQPEGRRFEPGWVHRRGRLCSAAVSGPQILPQLSVRRGREAVEFYEAAFGAEEVYRVAGTDAHPELVSELRIGEASFWVADESPEHANFSPETVGGSTTRLLLIVDDPDAVVERAKAAGATEVYPVHEEHGWLLGRIVDPYGHHWEIGRPLGIWPPR